MHSSTIHGPIQTRYRRSQSYRTLHRNVAGEMWGWNPRVHSRRHCVQRDRSRNGMEPYNPTYGLDPVPNRFVSTDSVFAYHNQNQIQTRSLTPRAALNHSLPKQYDESQL